MNVTLASALAWVDLIQGIVTTLGIIVAGIWTYQRFVKGRLREPRAELSHAVTAIQLANNRVLLRVALTIHNTGNVAVESCKGTLLIQTVPDENRIATNGEPHKYWHTVQEIELPFLEHEMVIEPNERETYYRDVSLESNVSMIQLHSRVNCTKHEDSEIWDETTIHVLFLQETHGR